MYGSTREPRSARFRPGLPRCRDLPRPCSADTTPWFSSRFSSRIALTCRNAALRIPGPLDHTDAASRRGRHITAHVMGCSRSRPAAIPDGPEASAPPGPPHSHCLDLTHAGHGINAPSPATHARSKSTSDTGSHITTTVDLSRPNRADHALRNQPIGAAHTCRFPYVAPVGHRSRASSSPPGLSKRSRPTVGTHAPQRVSDARFPLGGNLQMCASWIC